MCISLYLYLYDVVVIRKDSINLNKINATFKIKTGYLFNSEKNLFIFDT